ncbi:DUF202 domain-containing protein [Gordonia sp. PKS22-38]|uniref:DUF202 domain-containing protein n=1 Tax=Gordonia prachuapensis TaxID=3115651 RepID=A0ABU7MVP9_9ACTN|nr:DUF202 domain-containing protein [Gordonia sp. PKS22-38]
MTSDAGTAGAAATPSTVPGAVDARFTLAAERTVLAWVRTSLGFMAAGVAIVYVAADIEHPILETALGLMMVALGCVIALLGAWRWRKTMRALREGGEMPGPSHVTFLVIGIVIAAVAIAVVMVVQT